MNGPIYKKRSALFMWLCLAVVSKGYTQSNVSAPNEFYIVQGSVVDSYIPFSSSKADNTFAVIIANENYNGIVPNVKYAENDGNIFKEYCNKTLGIPEKHIRYYTNATYGNMLRAINDIKGIAQSYNGNIKLLFYYAGHGIPNNETKDAYLLPVDADGTQTEVCFPVNKLYQELASTKAKETIVILDACFSGAQRGDGMLMAARGIALKSKSGVPMGNTVALCAAQGDETAFPYEEERHGMFTFYLLKKIQETQGEVTLSELCDYLFQQVQQQSMVENKRMQSPTITVSASVGDNWKNWTLK